MPLKLKSTFFSDRHNYKNLYLLVFFAASIKKVRNHTYIDYYFSWFNWHQCCVYISSIVCIQHYISGHIELTFLMLFPYYASFAIYMYNILTLCKIEVKILKKSYILKFWRRHKKFGIRNKSCLYSGKVISNKQYLHTYTKTKYHTARSAVCLLFYT